MIDLLNTTLDRFVAGNGFGGPQYLERLSDLTSKQTRCVVVDTTSRRMVGQLARHGYGRTRSFIVLPWEKRARWLLPEETTHTTLAGLEIYAPYAPAARVLKALLRCVLKTGWQSWARDRVLVASTNDLPLELLIGEITGEHRPAFALSVGTPGRFRKLTIQVMRPNGEILGYIKLPLTEHAKERVRHEAEVLRRLWNFAALRCHIPEVLHAGEWGDGYILFQTHGPSTPGPIELTGLHQVFLKALSSVHQIEKPGPAVVEGVRSRWQKAEPRLDSTWCALGESALGRAKAELDRVMVPCGIVHGDFAPWNTRVENGRLYVFDWESAVMEAPVLWDVLHFRIQVASLLNKNSALRFRLDGRSGEKAIFLLYLLTSVCADLEEEIPTFDTRLGWRKRLLAEQLFQS